LGVTRVADSSFIIALFDESDERQQMAQGWASDPEPIVVPAEVMAETMVVVHRRKGVAAALDIWNQLILLPHVAFLETSETERAAKVFSSAKGKLSWVDAVVVARCREGDLKPLSFDAHIERAVRR
jgi:predicted nucleic acid-binding protein